MITQAIINLFRQLLRQLQRGTWFIIDEINHEIGTLCFVTGLSVEEYEAVMLTSGIIRRRQDNFMITAHSLVQLSLSLQHLNLIIHTTRCKFPNRDNRNYFLELSWLTRDVPTSWLIVI